MPILRPFSKKFPKMFPAGYSGTQVLRFALKDGPEQRLYQAGDYGLAGHRNLSAYILGYETISSQADLQAIISVKPFEDRDLPAAINAVLKQGDFGLRGIIRGWAEDYRDLSAFIRGMVIRDLPAFLRALTTTDLPANVYGIPPVDLPAYLKVWPQEDLPANLHGWQYGDLGASISWYDVGNLGSYIGTSFPRNLRALIKGWVREATSDLGAYIDGFTYEELQGIIRATYLEDLPGYLFCIQPADLNGLIHGWQESDLGASIIGLYGPYDLHGYIGGHVAGNLPATITADGWTLPYYKNLQGLIYAASILKQQGDLAAYIATHAPANLQATITAAGGIGNLPAFIYPKTIYMTGIVTVATMEHSNLSAVINFICRGSGYLNLPAYIRCTYLANLASTIIGYKIPTYSANLAATIGYADSYVFKDKLPISIGIGSGYQIEDKIPISLRIFKQQAYLGGYVVGEYRHSDMPATITATWLEEYSFDNTKSREIVYDLNHARQVNWYEVVEMYFRSMVPDYFYVGAEGSVYKTNRLDRWILDISSYIPQGMALNIRRKLHRAKNLYDLTDFNTLDEAIRFAIDYVTSYNYGNLGAYLNTVPKFYHTSDLPVRLRFFTPTDSSLSATITPKEKSFVLGYDDKVEFI